MLSILLPALLLLVIINALYHSNRKQDMDRYGGGRVNTVSSVVMSYKKNKDGSVDIAGQSKYN